jgi:hypothetical protein
MRPSIKNFKMPRVLYRSPHSTADPIKNYILLILILMLLSAFVLGSCNPEDSVRAGADKSVIFSPSLSLSNSHCFNRGVLPAQYVS